jgi:hypothetical protein
MGEFSCEPLKPTELRTLHLDEPFNVCDHTDYGPQSGNQSSVLKLYKSAASSILRLEECIQDPDKPNSKPQAVGLGTGFVVNSPAGDKVFVTAHHNEEEVPGAIPGAKYSYWAIDSKGKKYEVIPRTRDTNLIANLGDSTVMDFAKPKETSQLPALKIAKEPIKNSEQVLGLGYATDSDRQPYLYLSPGTVMKRMCLYNLGEGDNAKECLMGEKTPRLISRQHIENADSGGPQLNTAGEVVGVITNKLASRDPSVIPPTYSMSIPIEAVLSHLNKPHT